MKKLIAVAALVAGMLGSAAANAAEVDIILTQTGPGADTWNLTINNNGPTGVGIINYEIIGLTVQTVNPANSGISPLDSAINVDAFGPGDSFAAIGNNPGQAIAPANTLGSLLATLSGPTGQTVQLIAAETNAGQPTLFSSTTGAPFAESQFSLTVVPATVVPEPMAVVLIGLGLSGLALARRRAA